MLQKLLTAALILFAPLAWAEGTVSLTTGFDYTTGKYGGTDSTNILSIPFSGKYQTDDYFLKLTIPYISVTTAGGVVQGLGPIKKTTTRVTTQSGLGDITASAGYTVYYTDQLLLDLVGNIKFGTADAGQNLGTGENDYSTQLDGYYTLDTVTLLGTLGYKVIGAPAGVSVNNIVYGTVGFSNKLSDKASAGVLLDIAQATTDLAPGKRELTLFASNKINRNNRIQLYFLKGFSDSSPDYGMGLMLIGIMQ